MLKNIFVFIISFFIFLPTVSAVDIADTETLYNSYTNNFDHVLNADGVSGLVVDYYVDETGDTMTGKLKDFSDDDLTITRDGNNYISGWSQSGITGTVTRDGNNYVSVVTYTDGAYTKTITITRDGHNYITSTSVTIS